MGHYSQQDLDNYSRQLNPENDAYWRSRGYSSRPDNWDDDLSSANDYDDDYFDNCDYEDWCSDDFE